MAADKEAIEFALTTLVVWLEDSGHREIGGLISRQGHDYQFELKRLEDGDGNKSILPSQKPKSE